MEKYVDDKGLNRYKVAGIDVNEDHMITMYNEYCDNIFYAEFEVHENNKEFLDSYFDDREDLAEEIGGNSKYNYSDPYCAYKLDENKIVSGTPDECFSHGIIMRMESDIKNDKWEVPDFELLDTIAWNENHL